MELPAALVAVLEAERETLNARFAWRRRAGSRIDGDAFLDHLRRFVAPLVAHIDADSPDRTRAVVTAARTARRSALFS
jgi:hypothetical protein